MPETPTRRRDFLTNSATVAAASIAATMLSGVVADERRHEFKGRIRKALKYHMITEKLSAMDKLKMLKDIGFEGVEPRVELAPDKQSQVRELAAASEALDFPIHGVVNSSNPNLTEAIDHARMLGASSVLHVVRYDQKIGYLRNYQETLDIIRRATDHAAKQEISILLENVWASYLIEPMAMARFVDEIDSPWVQVYFDIGNVVRWGWPEHWIEVLGQRVKKLDVKEFDLTIAMNEGLRKGFGKPLGEGSIDWAKVRAELKKINYSGWATAEVPGGDRQHLADLALQMDRVLDL